MNQPHTGARPPRECGPCNVCCQAMQVTALDKPAGMACQHMTDHGCGIYAQRPKTCRDWHCMWIRDRNGVFTEQERPDRAGVFFTASRPTGPNQKQIVFAHPVRPDAATHGTGAAVIQRLQQFVPVKVLDYHPPVQPTQLTHDGQPLSRAA